MNWRFLFRNPVTPLNACKYGDETTSSYEYDHPKVTRRFFFWMDQRRQRLIFYSGKDSKIFETMYLALHNFESTYKSFPQSGIRGSGEGTWVVRLLPYMEQWGFRWNDIHRRHPSLLRAMVYDPDKQEWDETSLRIGREVCELFCPYFETETLHGFFEKAGNGG